MTSKLTFVLNSAAAALIGGFVGTTSCLVGSFLVPPSEGERIGWRNLIVPFLLGAVFGLMIWRAAQAIARRRGGSVR